MDDDFRDLVRDTLTYLKEQPRQPMLAAPEDAAFFKTAKPLEAPTTASKKALGPPPTAQVQKVAEVKQAPVVLEEVKSVKKVVTPDIAMDIKKTLQKIAPAIRLTDQVADDSAAKRIASAYKEKVPEAEVVLLVCDPAIETMEFFKTLAKAIDGQLAKAKILSADRIEREKRWDLFLEANSFRLIIASEGCQKYPELMRFYRANPPQFFLSKVPFLPLSAAASYQALEKKALLWKTLCQMLKK